MRIVSLVMLFISTTLSFNVAAASFDCAKAAAPVEKVICSNDYVSKLDEELGTTYKDALIKYADKRDTLILQQRNWIKFIRNACTSPACLATHYEERISELLTGDDVSALSGPEKPNFIITKGRKKPLCQEYLKILNQTKRDQLKACQLPDLTNSPFKLVEFTPLTGKKLKAIDKIVYEQQGGGPWKDWKQKWPERKKEYAMGYRRLGEAFWDLDNDGKVNHILEEQFPYSGCVLLKGGKAQEMVKIVRQQWKKLSTAEQLTAAKQDGFVSFYKELSDEKITFISARKFVTFNGLYFSIDQGFLTNMHTTNDWANKNWVAFWGLNPKRDDNARRYGLSPSQCEFWFNY